MKLDAPDSLSPNRAGLPAMPPEIAISNLGHLDFQLRNIFLNDRFTGCDSTGYTRDVSHHHHHVHGGRGVHAAHGGHRYRDGIQAL